MNARVTHRSPWFFVVVAGVFVACDGKPKPRAERAPEPGGSAELTAASGNGDVVLDPTLLGAFSPLPASFGPATATPVTDARVALGRTLYFDRRLSKDKDVSCQSCHVLASYGVDGQPTSKGHRGQRGARNSPSVYNAAGHFAQFWDGRARDVEEQAKGPILNPVEMAMPSGDAVVAELSRVPDYRARFPKAFPEDPKPLTFDNVARAIAAFERTLVTPSRWDRFLAGDRKAITTDEKRGFKKFESAGCTSCHNGRLVGGQTYQKIGVARPWPSDADLGRFAVTHDEADKLVFKVPSLRNVARTAPYFHDGSVPTLEDAIRKMAIHQLGKSLAEDDVQAIATWLGSLTGDLPPGVESTEPPPK